jgi:ureidoglycolate lyase
MAEAMIIQPLTADGFAPFGDVVEFEGRDSFPINDGMAERYHALADIELGGEQARGIISLVASRQFDMPRRVDHLEHHPLGSQAFLPLDASPFIVVFCPPATQPDLEKLQAFVTNGKQGINYRRGTWHHVLLTPCAPMRFICIDRAGPGNNCIDHHIPEPEQPLLRLD